MTPTSFLIDGESDLDPKNLLVRRPLAWSAEPHEGDPPETVSLVESTCPLATRMVVRAFPFEPPV